MKSQPIAKMCSEDDQCKLGLNSYASATVDARTRKQEVIGIAKDGHMIYGPYKDDGSLW